MRPHFPGWLVLLGAMTAIGPLSIDMYLPAFLAIALSIINREHMRPLFEEPMGRTLILVTIIMQLIGFVWIRKVIKIEV